MERSESLISSTCASAQESLTHWDAVTGVAGRDHAGLLLPVVDIARLPPKLRRLLQFRVAILWEKQRARLGTITAIITLGSRFHFVMSWLLMDG